MQGMVFFLGQVNWEVNTVAVSLVTMAALSPLEALWVCVSEFGGRALCLCVCGNHTVRFTHFLVLCQRR